MGFSPNTPLTHLRPPKQYPQALLCLVAAALCGVATAGPRRARALLQDDYCRGEETCMSQVCNPAAYEYDLATAGLDFPYSISYTTTGAGATTSFVFMVCSTPQAQLECSKNTPGCAPLKAVQIRMRDDMLEVGQDIVADPPGTMWPSCAPYGPGHLWDATALGALASQRASNTSCATLTVTVNSNEDGTASLKDVCQQGVVIKDSGNATVFDQTTLPASCLFVLEEQNGRVGYAAVVDESAMSLPQALALASATASPSPTPYGPTPYGSRRRLRAAAYARRPARLF